MRPIPSIQWWERINAFFWCYKRAFLLVSCKLSQCGVSPTVLNQKYSRELRQTCPPPQICSHAHTCCSWLGLWWWRWEWSLSRIPAYLPLRMLCKVKKKKKVIKAKYRPVQALSRRKKKGLTCLDQIAFFRSGNLPLLGMLVLLLLHDSRQFRWEVQ